MRVVVSTAARCCVCFKAFFLWIWGGGRFSGIFWTWTSYRPHFMTHEPIYLEMWPLGLFSNIWWNCDFWPYNMWHIKIYIIRLLHLERSSAARRRRCACCYFICCTNSNYPLYDICPSCNLKYSAFFSFRRNPAWLYKSTSSQARVILISSFLVEFSCNRK